MSQLVRLQERELAYYKAQRAQASPTRQSPAPREVGSRTEGMPAGPLTRPDMQMPGPYPALRLRRLPGAKTRGVLSKVPRVQVWLVGRNLHNWAAASIQGCFLPPLRRSMDFWSGRTPFYDLMDMARRLVWRTLRTYLLCWLRRLRERRRWMTAFGLCWTGEFEEVLRKPSIIRRVLEFLAYPELEMEVELNAVTNLPLDWSTTDFGKAALRGAGKLAGAEERRVVVVAGAAGWPLYLEDREKPEPRIFVVSLAAHLGRTLLEKLPFSPALLEEQMDPSTRYYVLQPGGLKIHAAPDPDSNLRGVLRTSTTVQCHYHFVRCALGIDGRRWLELCPHSRGWVPMTTADDLPAVGVGTSFSAPAGPSSSGGQGQGRTREWGPWYLLRWGGVGYFVHEPSGWWQREPPRDFGVD